MMSILAGLFLAIVVIGFLASWGADAQFKRDLKDDFIKGQNQLDAKWRQTAKENDWYYDSSWIGMGPDTSRHYDGTPR